MYLKLVTRRLAHITYSCITFHDNDLDNKKHFSVHVCSQSQIASSENRSVRSGLEEAAAARSSLEEAAAARSGLEEAAAVDPYRLSGRAAAVRSERLKILLLLVLWRTGCPLLPGRATGRRRAEPDAAAAAGSELRAAVVAGVGDLVAGEGDEVAIQVIRLVHEAVIHLPSGDVTRVIRPERVLR